MSASVRRWCPVPLVVLLSTLTGGAAREPSPRQPPPAEPQRQAPVFRASVDLVAIDAVVTDRDGRHVTDLTAGDFEVEHEGKVRPVRHAVYVSGTPWTAEQQASLAGAGRDVSASPPVGAPGAAEPSAGPADTAARPGPAAASLLAPSGIRPDQVRRAMALVVDDINLSFESTVTVRRALERFVDEQAQPGDLVAVVRTSAGMGSLQQFTTDRRVLREAVQLVQFGFRSRGRVAAFEPVVPAAYGLPALSSEAENTVEGLRDNMLTAGALGALRFVINGIQELPGRKSVVYFSDGFDVFDRQGSTRAWNAMLRLIEAANDAGVVVYTVDARGLQTAGLSAEDNPQVRSGGVSMGFDQAQRMFEELLRGSAQSRRRGLLNTQEALHLLAFQTGGLAVVNTNDLNRGLERVLDDQQGYYLLAYEPPPGGPPEPGARIIKVRVARPGLRVRARSGVFGPSDPSVTRVAGPDPLMRAALSPFAASALPTRLTTFFAHDPVRGPFLRSRLLVDSRALHPDTDMRGRRVVSLDFLTVTVDAEGNVLSSRRRPMTLTMTPADEARLLARGLIYDQWLTLPRGGAYQVRVAVREAGTGALGSASEFVLIPDVPGGQLALSSVVLRDARAGAEPLPGPTTDAADAPPADTFLRDEAALRVFAPGTRVAYTYEVYNPTETGARTGATGSLTATVTLWRGEEVVHRGATLPVQVTPAASARRSVAVVGDLTLDASLSPGTYAIEVVVTDPQRRRPPRQASRWAAFDVRPTAAAPR